MKFKFLELKEYTAGWKVADFFIGFGGTVLYAMLVGLLTSVLLGFGFVLAVVLLLLYVLLLVLLFYNKRKFIAIGSLALIGIIILFFGACVVILGGFPGG